MVEMTERSAGAAAQMGLRSSAGPFADALIVAAQARPEIVGVTADLAKYTDMQAFEEAFPDRFVSVGMAEQNLICVAAGMAQGGLVPVATTFGAFLTRRAQDFTIMQVALPRANVKLIGGVPGVTAGFGPSHTAIDDLAIMRAAPNMLVIDPCDTHELGQALTAALDHDGPVYLRQPYATHGGPPASGRDAFVLGDAELLRSGGDVGIVASGMMVAAALEAAEALASEGISASVLKISTLKPFDGEAVAALAARTKMLVTAENHSVIGGLFSAVCEALVRHRVFATVEPIGVADVFPPFGGLGYVAEQLNMTAGSVAGAARKLLERGGHA